MALNLVEGNTAQQVKVVITRSDTGAAQDLTGASVAMYFKQKGTKSSLFTLTNSSTGTDLSSGICYFSFSSSQLDVEEGEYQGEIEATFSDGTVETIFDFVDFFVRAKTAR
jgi:hypothetical protein